MIVKDFIEVLQRLPQDAVVITYSDEHDAWVRAFVSEASKCSRGAETDDSDVSSYEIHTKDNDEPSELQCVIVYPDT